MSTYENEIIDTNPAYIEALDYPAYFDRRWFRDLASPGVFDSDDFGVTLLGGMDIRVAPGTAYVEGLQVADQGMYRVKNLTNKDLTVPAANGSNPRLDQLIIRVMDDYHDGSTFNTARLEIVPGTATAGATLDNRLGAADLTTLDQASKNVELIRDFLVPAGASALVSGDMRDKRRLVRVGAGNASSGEATTASTVAGLVPLWDGKRGLLRIGSSPYEFLPLVYDATYGKWISEEFILNGEHWGPNAAPADFAVAASHQNPNTGEGMLGGLIPLKVFVDAGLTLQVRLAAWGKMVPVDGTEARLTVGWRQFDDSDTDGSGGTWSSSFTAVTAAEISFPGGDQLRRYRHGPWAACSFGAVKKHGQFGLMGYKIGGTSVFQLHGATYWGRWVSS